MQSFSATYNIFSKILKNPQKIFQLVKMLHKASQVYHTSLASIVLHSFRLYFKEGYSPKEAFFLGLLDPKTPEDVFSKCISKTKMLDIQDTINPISWKFLTADKGVFYRYCMAMGLPIPELYAIFFQNYAGWSKKGSCLKSRDDWCKFFGSELPTEFLIKPCNGAYGFSLYIFNKSKTGFVDPFGRSYSASDLYDLMNLDSTYDSFIIQERLKSHPDLVALCNSHYLQTIRVITFVDKQHRCQILHAFSKPITGNNIMDNHEHGRTGNLLAEISLENGTMKRAVTMTDNGLGMKVVKRHPDTNFYFEGFPLPLWGEVCKLAKEAAFKFAPIRTIGWDIGVTPEGPFLVEGNARYDPPSYNRAMDIILPAIQER
jgi:hypothetical protein